MRTHTGTTPPAEDPTALLLESHGRIRSFLALAGALSDAGVKHPVDLADTAGALARHFAAELALHVEDEEASILPRLAGRDRDVDAALVQMHRDHEHRHGPAVDRVTGILSLLAAEPGRHGELAPALGAAARALGDHFASHLAGEEEIVFPAVRRLLSEGERRAIVAEHRLRRAVVAGERTGAGGHSSR